MSKRWWLAAGGMLNYLDMQLDVPLVFLSLCLFQVTSTTALFVFSTLFLHLDGVKLMLYMKFTESRPGVIVFSRNWFSIHIVRQAKRPFHQDSTQSKNENTRISWYFFIKPMNKPNKRLLEITQNIWPKKTKPNPSPRLQDSFWQVFWAYSQPYPVCSPLDSLKAWCTASPSSWLTDRKQPPGAHNPAYRHIRPNHCLIRTFLYLQSMKSP